MLTRTRRAEEGDVLHVHTLGRLGMVPGGQVVTQELQYAATLHFLYHLAKSTRIVPLAGLTTSHMRYWNSRVAVFVCGFLIGE